MNGDSMPIAGDVCVALDLETTGLVAETDEIIEVGAVKFQGDRALDTFQALVNPYRTLTPFIRELTGITQADVDGGSPFAAVAPRLESFIGRNPIVGQNVDFDLGFLAKKGMSLSNPVYDTREMAAVLLPQHREYSLAFLAASLGIAHPNPHRALGDADVTAKVFHALTRVALEMDEGLLSELSRLYARARGASGPAVPPVAAGQGPSHGVRHCGLRPRGAGYGDPWKAVGRPLPRLERRWKTTHWTRRPWPTSSTRAGRWPMSWRAIAAGRSRRIWRWP